MVRILSLAVAAIAALAATTEAYYYRPSGAEVSGVVGATTKYVRSPCPALNSMANHGLIPRDGKNLTRALLKTAVMEVFNIDSGLADIMVGLGPSTPTFDLATLSTHNLIEHDVSLSRRDVYFGVDQSVADPKFLAELVVASIDGQLSLKNVADIRSRRIAECKAKNPECDFSANPQFIANAESGLLLRGLGGKNTETVPFINVFSFFVQERFPESFTRPIEPITFDNITATIGSLTALQVL